MVSTNHDEKERGVRRTESVSKDISVISLTIRCDSTYDSPTSQSIKSRQSNIEVLGGNGVSNSTHGELEIDSACARVVPHATGTSLRSGDQTVDSSSNGSRNVNVGSSSIDYCMSVLDNDRSSSDR